MEAIVRTEDDDVIGRPDSECPCRCHCAVETWIFVKRIYCEGSRRRGFGVEIRLL